MRRFLIYPLPYLIFLLAASLFLLQGCAGQLLHTRPASEQESRSVVSAFTEFQEVLVKHCNCCLDAEVDVEITVSGWFNDRTAKMTGYLQAMEPGYIKFAALNPLGQPIFVLAADGSSFKSMNIPESTAYTGTVYSETFRKFAPQGFAPENSYYWLTGRAAPHGIKVQQVRRDGSLDAYWLTLLHQDTGFQSTVLFDPVLSIILRHVILDERGNIMVDLAYGEYVPVRMEEGKPYPQGNSKSPTKGLCMLPTRISAVSNAGADKKITLKLHGLISDAAFTPDEFDVEIPATMQKLMVR